MKILVKTMLNFITLGALGFAIYAYFNPILGTFHFTRSDALMHVTGFAIVSCLLVLALPNLRRAHLIFWMCSVGILAEVAQPLFTRRRELSISDIGANALGILIGVVTASAFVYAVVKLKCWIKKKPNPESTAI